MWPSINPQELAFPDLHNQRVVSRPLLLVPFFQAIIKESYKLKPGNPGPRRHLHTRKDLATRMATDSSNSSGQTAGTCISDGRVVATVLLFFFL